MELDEPPFENSTSSRSNKGYAPLPTQEYPPPYDRPVAAPYPPPAAPAPVVQQQQSSSNVVVVGNQPSPTPQVVHLRRADDNLIVTVCLFVLCLFLGNAPVMICLFPALIFSCIASTYNDAGNYDLARRFGSLACKCNIAAVIPAIFLLLGAVIAAIIVTLLAVGIIDTAASSVTSVTSVTIDN